MKTHFSTLGSSLDQNLLARYVKKYYATDNF